MVTGRTLHLHVVGSIAIASTVALVAVLFVLLTAALG